MSLIERCTDCGRVAVTNLDPDNPMDAWRVERVAVDAVKENVALRRQLAGAVEALEKIATLARRGARRGTNTEAEMRMIANDALIRLGGQ